MPEEKTGKWRIEAGELKRMNINDVDTLKAYLSRKTHHPKKS